MKYCTGCMEEIAQEHPFRSGIYCSQKCIDKFLAWERDFMSKPIQKPSKTPLRKEAVEAVLAALLAPMERE